VNPAAILPFIEAIIRAFARRRAVKNIVLPLVEAAAVKYPALSVSYDERRDHVIEQLRHHGLSESDARLLTEAGVKLWKKLEAKHAKKAAKEAKKRNQ